MRNSTVTIAVIALTALAACSDDPGGDPSPIDAADPTDAARSDGAGPGDGGPADGPPAGRDPAMPGTWQVHTAMATIALGTTTVAGTVYSPSTDGASPAAGPFPLIVVSSGFQLARTQYRIFCEHLATWGHVCVTHEYAASGNHQDKAREIGRILDWALSPASGLAARVDAAAIGVAGHSLGGKVSINAAILEPRIRAVVGWDPVDALPPFGNDGSTSVTPEQMSSLRVPFAVIGELTDSTGGIGGMSCAPAADNYQRYFEAACEAPATFEVTVAMADHMDWIGDRSSCGFACLACASGQTPDATVHEITRRLTAAWFLRHLRGDTSMDTWLTAARIGTPTTVRTSPGC